MTRTQELKISVYISSEVAIKRGLGRVGIIEYPLEGVIGNFPASAPIRSWLSCIYPCLNERWPRDVDDLALSWLEENGATAGLSEMVEELSERGFLAGICAFFAMHKEVADKALEYLTKTSEYYSVYNDSCIDPYEARIRRSPACAFLSSFFPEMLPGKDILRSAKDREEEKAMSNSLRAWQDKTLKAFSELEKTFIPNITDVGYFRYSRVGECAWKLVEYEIPSGVVRALDNVSAEEKARFNCTRTELDAICARLTELNRQDALRRAAECAVLTAAAAAEEAKANAEAYAAHVEKCSGLVSILDSDPYTSEMRKAGVFSREACYDGDNTLIVDPVESIDVFYDILISKIVRKVSLDGSSARHIKRCGYTIKGEKFISRYRERPSLPDAKAIPGEVQREMNFKFAAALKESAGASEAFDKAGFEIGVSPVMWSVHADDDSPTGQFVSRFFIRSKEFPENTGSVFVRWLETPFES